MAKRDVELIIRARDEATKGISAIAAALDKLENAQDATGDSAVQLAAEMAKLGSMGDAGKALKQIGADVERVNKVLQRQEQRLEESGAEVREYTDLLTQAKARLDKFKSEQTFVGPLNKKELKAQAAALKEVETGVSSMETKLAKVTTRFTEQQQEVTETRKALDDLKTTSAQATADVAKLAAAERKIGVEAELAAQKTARLKARMAELKGARDALAASKPVDTAVLGSGDPAAQVRKAKAEFQSAAARLAKLRNEFRRTAAPSEALGRQLGEQAVTVRQLYRTYQALSAQGAAVVAASVQKQQAAAHEAEAQRKATAAAEANTVAQRKLAEQQAAARVNRATDAVRTSALDVGPQLVRQKQLEQAVLELKGAYTAYDNELRRVQATHGPFGAQQDALRAKMINLKGVIAQGEGSLRRYATSSSQAGSGAAKLGNEVGRAAGGLRRGATEAKNANNELLKLINGTRQSLGLLQRIRGQFLAIGASYIGVFGAVNFTKGIADAQRDMDSIRNRFLVGFGDDQRRAAEELEYTKRTANELGLEFRTLAKEYSKLTAASLGTNLEGENTRRIFKAVAQAARVLNLSTDDVGGAYKAFSDIISKGTVQAEELKGQLGDRFPGAVQLMAKALGIGTKELMKMMEQGQLTSDSLVYFADAMAKRVAGTLPNAVNTFDAQLQRLKNAWFDVQVALGESGFLDGIASGMERLAEALKDPAVVEGFREMGKSLGDLIAMISELLLSEEGIRRFGETVRHAGTAVTGLLLLVGGATVIQSFMVFGTAIKGAISLLQLFATTAIGASMIGALKAMGTAVVAAAATLTGPMIAAIAGVMALLAAPFIAKWAYDNFPPFRKMVIEWGDSFLTGVEFIILQIKKLAAFIKQVFVAPLATIKAQWMSTWGSVFNWLADRFESAGASDWAAKFRVAAQDNFDASKAAMKDYHAEVARLEEEAINNTVKRKQETAAKLKEIDAEIARNAAEEQKKLDLSKRRGGKSMAQTGIAPPEFGELPPWEPGEGTRAGGKAKLTETEKLAKKVETKIEQLRQRLAELQGDDTTLPMAKRVEMELAAIESKYKPVLDDLTKLGKDRNSEEWKTVEALIEQEKLLVRQKMAEKQLRDEAEQRETHEKRVNELQSLREQTMNRIKFLQDQGDAGSIQQADELKLKLQEVDAELLKAIEDSLAFLAKFNGPEIEAAKMQLLLLRDTVNATNKEMKLGAADIGKAFGQQLSTASSNWIDKIAETGDVFGSLRESFREFAREFLIQIAKMIMQQIIFNALQAGASAFGGPVGAFFGGATGAVSHAGGMAGASGRTRNVSAALFANAVRYHNGGIAGLAPNEVPSILERGEEIIRRDDPRHMLNGGGAAASGGAQPNLDVKIINTIDAGEFVSEGMSTAVGQKAIVNYMRTNRGAVRSALGL